MSWHICSLARFSGSVIITSCCCCATLSHCLRALQSSGAHPVLTNCSFTSSTHLPPFCDNQLTESVALVFGLGLKGKKFGLGLECQVLGHGSSGLGLGWAGLVNITALHTLVWFNCRFSANISNSWQNETKHIMAYLSITCIGLKISAGCTWYVHYVTQCHPSVLITTEMNGKTKKFRAL